MTNLPYSSLHCSRQRENASKLPRAAVSGRERNGERNKILGAHFVTRSNYFVTSDRQLGSRRPRLSLRDATGSRRFRFDRPDSIDYTIRRFFELEKGKDGASRCVSRHSSSIELIAVCYVELNLETFRLGLDVLHPFCKLTVIRVPRCPTAPIDRHSPIRHRKVRESRCFLHRARRKNSNCGITPIPWSRILCDRRFYRPGRKSKESISDALSHCAHNGRL